MDCRYPVLFTLFSFLLAASAFALETPTVDVVTQGFGKVVLEVTAGGSGAPDGFTVWWMTAEDYAANGWIYEPTPIQGAASFNGTPTLNTWDGTVTTFVLAPNQSIKIEIGDLEDETGVWSNSPVELDADTEYVFCVSANAAAGDVWYPASLYSSNQGAYTPGGQDCTFTQGYWKNHPEEWPVLEVTLGTVEYDQSQLLAIFSQPAQGNGLVFLAHQLIATKLNLANGSDPAAIIAAVTAADALIADLIVPPVGSGSIHPRDASPLTQELDDYNNGITGPGHCPPISVESSRWGSLKERYR